MGLNLLYKTLRSTALRHFKPQRILKLLYWFKRYANFTVFLKCCLLVESHQDGSATNGATPSIFTESALRPIQSVSRDVRLSLCLSVTP